VRVVFDHPGKQVINEIGRWAARFAGSLLVLIGLLSTVVAIPTGFVTLGDIVNNLQSKPETLFEPGFPLRLVEAAFVASMLVAILAIRYGRRLFRGRRRIVLFLRRFGYDGAQEAVTYAVANTIGTSWRLVTLDDDEIAPVGVDTTSTAIMTTGERIVALAGWVYKLVMVVFPWAIWGMGGILILQALSVAPDWNRLLSDGTVDRYAAIFTSVMERRIPSEYFEFSLSGAFAVLATVFGFAFAGLMICFGVLLAMLPLFGFMIFASSSAEALRKAEREKSITLRQIEDIGPMVSRLSQLGQQTFAPRLVVARVAGGIWQKTVTALSSVASAVIIDVSEPTFNLAWEVSEIDRLDVENRCIFIADHARITRSEDLTNSTSSNIRYIASQIGDRDVLAYSTDRAGMRRFARALHGMLLDIPNREP
jgi:hypothetical protein